MSDTEYLNMVAVLDVTDGQAYVQNAGESFPVEAFTDSQHDLHDEAVGALGGPDLAVVPYWPAWNFGFTLQRAELSANGERLYLYLPTDLPLGTFLTVHDAPDSDL